ncbi:DUF2567 domain-containing protein [Mycobacterium sp.]|uniref:DUF2567 domain-containing protein n=1 Tax=Mycobacterium sp. TaxID=1785 RepID=UPI003BAC9A7B
MTEQPESSGPAASYPLSDSPRMPRAQATLLVMLGLAVTGVFVGGLWAWIAPPIHAVVAITNAGERVHEYLGAESQNFFVAPLLLQGLLGVIAVVAAVLVWQWRDHRGPAMILGLLIGLVAAALAAAAVGAVLVRLRYGALEFDTVQLSDRDHALTYVTQAPPVFFARRMLEVAATLVSPAAVGSLVYALLAAGIARDDLGGFPAVDHLSSVVSEESAAPKATES